MNLPLPLLHILCASRLRGGLLIALLLTCLQLHGASDMTALPWKSPQGAITFTKDSTKPARQNLHAALELLCKDQGVLPELGNVGQLADPKFPASVSRTEFLRDLLEENGLDAVFFISTRKLVLFKANADPGVSYRVDNKEASDKLLTALKSSVLGLQPQFNASTGLLQASGPNIFIDHLEKTAAGNQVKLTKLPPTPQPDPSPTGKAVTMIFPLRYARADRETNKLRAQPLSSGNAGVAVNESAGVVAILNSILIEKPGTPNANEPLIASDPLRNAVIIVDVPSRQAFYQELIDRLDVPRFMVEITAAIVDIEVSDGLDWQSSFLIRGTENVESREVPYRVGFGTDKRFFTLDGQGNPTGSVFENTPPQIPPGLTSGALGLNQTTLIVGSSYAILSNIRTLQQAGKAQVLSRPSVLTVDNQPARLTDLTSAVIPVAGERQSYLYKIASGLDLVVLPRIVYSDDGQMREVYLGIEVGDGNVSDSNTADVAAFTSDNRVVTQAVVQDGQSLLIGGRYRNQEIKSESGIPIISKIPIVGLPFKNKKVTNAKFQRLYLITPKIIDPDTPLPPSDSVLQMLGPQLSAPMPVALEKAREPAPSPIPPQPEPTPEDEKPKKTWFKSLFRKNSPTQP